MILTATTKDLKFSAIDMDALQKAVNEERYEDAALIRDGINPANYTYNFGDNDSNSYTANNKMNDYWDKLQQDKKRKEDELINKIQLWRELVSIVYGYPTEAIEILSLEHFKMLVAETCEYINNLKLIDAVQNKKLIEFLKKNDWI